jgi:hypothetical protein
VGAVLGAVGSSFLNDFGVIAPRREGSKMNRRKIVPSARASKVRRALCDAIRRPMVEGLERRTMFAAVLGVTSINNLIRFDTATPGTVTTIGPISGLVGGDSIVSIDIRPATGELFGLGSGSRLYKINPATAAATQVGADGQFTLPPGQSFGFDFNPTVDRIRVTSDSEQNFRLNPNNGTRPGGVDDTTLTFPTAGGNFDAGGAAYTNNFGGATVTTLYDMTPPRTTLSCRAARMERRPRTAACSPPSGRSGLIQPTT